MTVPVAVPLNIRLLIESRRQGFMPVLPLGDRDL